MKESQSLQSLFQSMLSQRECITGLGTRTAVHLQDMKKILMNSFSHCVVYVSGSSFWLRWLQYHLSTLPHMMMIIKSGSIGSFDTCFAGKESIFPQMVTLAPFCKFVGRCPRYWYDIHSYKYYNVKIINKIVFVFLMKKYGSSVSLLQEFRKTTMLNFIIVV